MIVQPFLLKVELAIGEVNVHIAACEETREAMLIDAGKFDPAMAEYVKENGFNLTTIFITHDHSDHVDGVRECVDQWGAKIISGTPQPGGVGADRVVKHGDEVALGSLRAKVVETSGHTPVGLSLIFPGCVFSGDALFAGSVGGTGTPETYERQIQFIRDNLLTLPDEYEVHSGHGPATTIGIERTYNPFFVSF